MKYESAKSSAAVKLSGIDADFEMMDGVLKSVVLTDGKGGHVKLTMTDYNSFRCLVPARPKTADRYVLHGDIEDIGKVRKVFESQREADLARQDIEGRFRQEIDLKIEKVALPIDDDGAVAENDIPF